MPWVKGHYRTLPDGRQTWVRGHWRGAPSAKEVGVGVSGFAIVGVALLVMVLLNLGGSEEQSVKKVTPTPVSPSATITELPRFVVP